MRMCDDCDLEMLAQKYGGLYLDEDDVFNLKEQVTAAQEALDRHDLGAARKALCAIERVVE